MSGDKKTKILLWSPFRGKVGTEKAAINYARCLNEIGFEVVIVQLLDEFDHYKDEFRVISLWPKKLDYIGKSNYLYRRDFYILGFFSSNRLSKILKNENFDIAISFLMAVPLIKAIKKNNSFSPKLILSVQGFPKFFLENDKTISKLESKIRKYFWVKNYQFATNIILMTEHTKQLMSNQFPSLRKKLKIIENPLFDNSVKNFHDFRTDSVRKIFFVGRYSYQKDFELFSDVTRILSKTPSCNIEFHVFGNFPENIRSASENRHINFRGYEPNFWLTLNCKNDIHLITARWDDPGHAMLEGLALRYKTIVTDRVSPHVDLARSFGLPIVPADPKVMALNIEQLIDTPQNPEVCDQLSRIVVDIYGSVNFKQKVTNLLQDTLASSNQLC